jgi:hypothetical protein
MTFLLCRQTLILAIAGNSEFCPYSIRGSHMPHVVLKDNDFHRKLRVLPETGEALFRQLGWRRVVF